MTQRTVVAALTFIFIVSSVPVNSSADDIPHENYDLVGSNLDALIALLNSSIGYSEFSLTSMYFEAMNDVNENLTIVQGLLTPAELLLEKIRSVATSYENLSLLLPPFADLSGQMSSFAGKEVSLLDARYNILTAAQVVNLTGDTLIQALDSIKRFNTLIIQMNRTIDDMLVSANRIVNLTVEDERPFTDNQLVPLIERLRELLRSIELEIEAAIHGEHGENPWSETKPFLILWLADSSYYLGDVMIGGGYLYYGGAFQASKTIDLLIDSENLTQARTTAGGKYYFSYEIPLNASWLGTHSITANASTPNGTLSSEPVSITITLIPTTIALTPNGALFTIDGQFDAKILLRDVKRRPIENATCHLALDAEDVAFTTGIGGAYDHVVPTSELGYGSHSAQAFYEGVLPYASSSSGIAEFVVDIPTSVSLRLFATRLAENRFVVGNGTLHANQSELLPGQEITLSVDGVVVANLTTDAHGEFAFTIPTHNMLLGGHVLKAEFIHKDRVWRYSSDELGFTVVGKKVGKYPFFPFLGKWADKLSPDVIIPYLFIGPYAYIFWLLLLTMIGLAVRVIQIRGRQIEEARREKESLILSIDKAVALSPAAFSAEDLTLELQKAADAPATPNERIVLYYQRLLSFLARRGRVSLKASMTHWEVARLLKSLGYPSRSVERVTVLFERAFYSGTALSDEDTVNMSSAVTGLVAVNTSEVARAS